MIDLTGEQSSCCWRFWAARAKGREAIPQNQIRSNNFVDGVFADTFYDLESGTNHTANRQQSSTEGRWLTPDPAGLAAMDISSPQTWNRYAYVNNNPVSASDPTGLDSYLSCTPTDKNASTCQQQIVGNYNSQNLQTAWVQGTSDANGRVAQVRVRVLDANLGYISLPGAPGSASRFCELTWVKSKDLNQNGRPEWIRT